MCFREKGDLGDKDKSVDLQLSPYQSMRGLGSEELDLQKITHSKVWMMRSRQLMDENDKNWNQKKMVQMINSVDSTKPLSRHEGIRKWGVKFTTKNSSN